MRMYFLILLIGLMLPFRGLAQGVNKKDFDELLSYFKIPEKNKELHSDYDAIPKRLTDLFLGNEFQNGLISSIYPLGILDKDNSIILIIEVSHTADTGPETFCLITLSPCGNLITSEFIGITAMDSEGNSKYECGITLLNDSLLFVHQNDIGIDSSGNEYIYKIKNYYYLINKNGFSEIKSSTPSSGRKYPESSLKVLDEKEVMKMSKTDLDIMRNEIYANYGYRFKSKKWKEYFSAQSWYKPMFDDVNDKLTLIEKINIITLMKLAHY